MDSKNYISFSLIFLVSVTLCLVGTTEARFRGVNAYCRTSDYKQLCTRMVHGATTLDQATESAILSTLDLAKKWTPRLSSQLAPALIRLLPISQKSILETCKENFENVLENLEEALHHLKAGDKDSVNTKLSASSFSDCTDAFQESGLNNTPLSTVARLLARHVSNCLAVSQQI